MYLYRYNIIYNMSCYIIPRFLGIVLVIIIYEYYKVPTTYILFTLKIT